MQSIRTAILKYAPLGLVFLMPLLYISGRVYPYITSKTFFFYAVVEVLAALWVYSAFVDVSYRLSKKQWFLLMPLLAYVGWMGVTTLAAVDPMLAFWSGLGRGTGFLTLAHCALFAVVIIGLMNCYGAWTYAKQLLTWSVWGGGVFALTIWFGDEGFNIPIHMLQAANGGGTIGNSSLAAAYLMFIVGFIGILIAAGDVSRSAKGWMVTLAVLILTSPLFINIYGLFVHRGILGSARGAVLGILVGSGVSLLAYWALSKQKLYRGIGIGGLAVGVIAFVVVWMKLLTPGTAINTKFTQATLGTRFIFWHIGAQVLHERPLLGYGPENFPNAVSHYFDPRMLDKSFAFEAWTDRAHNIYIDTGVAGGYPAIALYALLIASIMYGAVRARNREIFSQRQSAILIGMITGYVFQNLFVFDSTVSLVMLTLVAAIVYGISGSMKNIIQQDRGSLAPSMRSFVAVGIAILAIASWYNFSYLPSRKAVAFSDVLTASVNKRASWYPELLKGSSIGNQWDVSGFGHDLYKFYAKDPMSVKNDKALLPYAVQDVDAFTNYAEQIAKQNTTDYRLYLDLIHLYSTKIFFTDMKYDPVLATRLTDIVTHAQSLAPRDPQGYWAVGQIAAWKGDLQGVINAYQQAIDIDPTLPAGHRLLIGFLTDIKANKLAAEALANAKKAIPDFSMN